MLSLFSAAACAASAQTVVSIESPGFEGTGDPWLLPSGWSGVASSTNGTFRWISGTAGNEVHSGTRAVTISSPDAGTTQARLQQVNAFRFAVNAASAYTISLWAKGTDLDLARDRFRVSVEWWNAAGTGVVSTWISPLQTLPANGSWQEFSVTSTAAPATAATAKILIFFERAAESASSTPVIAFDDLSVATAASIPEPSFVALVCGAGALLAAGWVRRWRAQETC